MDVREFEETPCGAFWRKASIALEFERERLLAERDMMLRIAALQAAVHTEESAPVIYSMWTGRSWETGEEVGEADLRQMTGRQTTGDLMDAIMSAE